MNITRNEEEEEEELPPPDVDASSLQRVLERHPLFSSLPESVLTVECVVGPLLSMIKSRDMDVYRRIVVSLV